MTFREFFDPVDGWASTIAAIIGGVSILGSLMRKAILRWQRPPPPNAKIIHNERIRLQANVLNTIAAGLVVTGVIGPMATYLYGTTAETKHTGWQILGEIVSLVTAGGIVHGLANWSLGRLEP